MTFLFVTHDQEEALSLSDSLAVMRAGRIEQMGPPAELYRKPRTKFVASFMGAMNWIGDVGVRPEAMRLALTRPPADARIATVIPATVSDTAFLGPIAHVTARLANGSTAMVQVPSSDAPFRPGDSVYLSWNSSDELHGLS